VDTIVKLWDKLCALGLLLTIIGIITGFIPVGEHVDPIILLLTRIPIVCFLVWSAGRVVLWLIKVIIS
jgi:hypothetical protein